MITRATGEMNWQLRQAREKRMWSMEKAAEKCGVDTQTYFRWEAGKQGIRLSSLEMLSAAFGELPEHLGFGARFANRIIKEDARPSQVTPEALKEPQETASLTESRLSVQQERSMSFGELQERVERVLRRFLDMEQLSRRTLIALLTSVPAAAFALTFQGESPLLRDDEVVSLAAVNIPLAWRLYFAGGLDEVRETLPTYINKLSAMAGQPSRYQQRAAGLTSQAHQLGYLLALQSQNFGLAMDHAKQAFHYAQIAEDNNLRLASLVRQGNLYHVMKRPAQTLLKYQEAIQYRDQTSPLLLGQAYIGLAEAYAKTGQGKEAQRLQGLALETFPADPQEDLHFAYTHFNHFTRVNFEGLMYIHMGQPQQAWDSFATIEHEVPSTLVPQRVELMMRQTLALVAMRDMSQSCERLELATAAALKLGSDLRYNEAGEIYDQMLLKWPHEQKVRRLEELFHLDTSTSL